MSAVVDTSDMAIYDDERDDETGITLKRIVKQHRARRIAFWNVATGDLYSERGAGMQLAPHTPLSQVLGIIERLPAAQRPRSLYLIGGESAATTPRRSWWAEPAQPRADGEPAWLYDGYELAAHAATGGQDATENAGSYERGGASGGCRVDVRMSALWFPGVPSARDARDAWNTLALALRRTFDEHATLLATPAMTGLDLLHRSLPVGARYPLAPRAFRDLLHSISGQGRFEFCPDPSLAGATISGLYVLDARWMYAACVRGLPVGYPERRVWPYGADAQEGYLAYRPAWYRVNIQVPGAWAHLGLIAQRVATGGQETIYPAEPGQWIRDVWTTGAELAVALQQRWPVLIYERWAYEDERPAGMPDPTRYWIDHLRALRDVYAVNAPVAAAIRHLAIDAVGMWHRTAGEKLRITPLRDYPGEERGARLHHLDRRAKLAYWYEPKPLARDALPWQRPEWSTTVWGRARARLNESALRIPREQLVDYRADALITCAEPVAARWLDDGKPGTFRRKPGVPGPLVMPASEGELLELRRRVAAANEG